MSICVHVQAKAMLNAVNALPQMEQADKLMARMPPAKWAAEVQIAASRFRLPTPLLCCTLLGSFHKTQSCTSVVNALHNQRGFGKTWATTCWLLS